MKKEFLLFFTIVTFSLANPSFAGQKYNSIDAFPHWSSLISSYKNLTATSKNATYKTNNATLEEINRNINKVRYVADIKNWGKGDYWATPEDFYRRGGDCEDYAIAKYFKLLDAGYKPENMEIMALFKRKTNEYHAVLKVVENGKTYILDNEYNKLMSISYLKDYDIMYYLSNKGWRV